MKERLLYSQEHIVSLTVVASAVFFFYFFPVPFESLLQNIVTLIAFLVVLPMLYVRFVLKNVPADVRIQLPTFKMKELVAFLSMTIAGTALLTVFYFLPYLDAYKGTIGPVIDSFGEFAAYEMLYVLPMLSLGVYFSHIFIENLALPKELVLTLKIVAMTTISIGLLQLPIFIIVFFSVIYGISWYTNMKNYYLIVISMLVPLIALDMLIARTLIS